MTPEIITTFVIVAFLVILLAGFVFGLIRGFNKSLIRILLVVAMLVLTFFIVPKITQAAMTLDISNWGVTIAGETATSVGDVIVSLLNQIPQVADIAGTSAYATIINVVPQMILNVVLFIVVFILLRLVSMIIYWIISGICFSKKKTEGKNKHRLLGSLVGVIQNFIIFLVILVPVVGTINILGDIEAITNAPTTQAVSTLSVSDPETQDPANNQISPYQTIMDVKNAYNDAWVAKFLHAVKIDNACMYVFNELTTVTEKEVEYNLRDEATSVANIVIDVVDLTNLGDFDLSKPEVIQALNKVIDSCYNSKFAANLVDEVIPLATAKWVNGETFCGISKPVVEGYDDVINDLLVKLGSSENIRATLKSTISLMGSVFNTAKELFDGETVDITTIGTLLDDLSKDENTLDLVKEVLTEETITDILDNVMPEEGTDGIKDMITETITTVLNADYTQEGADISNEIEVVTETLKATEKLMNPTAENPFEQADANKVIEKLSESKVILETIANESSDIRTQLNGILDQNTTAKDMIEEAINNLPAENLNKATLLEIFGFVSE